MRLRHTVFASRITGFALFRTDLTLAGYAALKLGSYFLTTALLEWISATAQAQRTTDRDQDR
jgi:hypothetical protein